MAEIEKLDLKSMDITEDKIQKLKQLFPEVITEGNKVDFERLKTTLGESIDTGKERYGMNWPGKADCFKIIQQPSIGTLVPVRKESVDFDTTENLFIEGDNLEVLKLLQKAYLGKIKMICIDPPYNTGNDFIYPDNYSESLDTYLRYTGQLDSEGRRYSTNTETDGRFHSKWLSMMYPRLFLARNLLREDGVIFIFIDDNEVDNLKKICNEIFGEENFIACIANVNNPKGRSDDKFIATAHDYILIYMKREAVLYGWKPEEKVFKRYNKNDEKGQKYREIDLRKTGDEDRKEDREDMFYYFYYNENTKDFFPSREKLSNGEYIEIVPIRENGTFGRWRWGIETAKEKINTLIPKFMPVRKIWSVFEMDYLSPDEKIKPTSAWTKKDFNNERGTEQFIELGFKKEVFPRPKPVGLLKHIIEFTTTSHNDDIVLDFFAGSCTSAHAVVEQNKEDGGNRKFICVQLPESCDEKSETFREDFKTIADIGKERIRRVIQKINKEMKDTKLPLFPENNPTLDLGFKVFKLSSSNFKLWDANASKEKEAIQKQLSLHVDHISPSSSQEDILYEILLKSGFPLTTKIEQISLAGKTVFSIAEGAMLICLEKELTAEVMKAIAEKKPVRVVCLDAGFKGNDQLKTNAVQIMKSKKITDFRTV